MQHPVVGMTRNPVGDTGDKMGAENVANHRTHPRPTCRPPSPSPGSRARSRLRSRLAVLQCAFDGPYWASVTPNRTAQPVHRRRSRSRSRASRQAREAADTTGTTVPSQTATVKRGRSPEPMRSRSAEPGVPGSPMATPPKSPSSSGRRRRVFKDLQSAFDGSYWSTLCSSAERRRRARSRSRQRYRSKHRAPGRRVRRRLTVDAGGETLVATPSRAATTTATTTTTAAAAATTTTTTVTTTTTTTTTTTVVPASSSSSSPGPHRDAAPVKSTKERVSSKSSSYLVAPQLRPWEDESGNLLDPEETLLDGVYWKVPPGGRRRQKRALQLFPQEHLPVSAAPKERTPLTPEQRERARERALALRLQQQRLRREMHQKHVERAAFLSCGRRVLPKVPLWIGGEPAARNMEWVLDNVDVVLNVANARQDYPSDRITLKHVSLEDSPAFKLTPHLPSLCHFLHDCLSRGKSVLVHCQLGKSRSASVILAYLVAYANMTLKDAWDQLARVNRGIKPNAGFRRALRQWECRVRHLEESTLALSHRANPLTRSSNAKVRNRQQEASTTRQCDPIGHHQSPTDGSSSIYVASQ